VPDASEFIRVHPRFPLPLPLDMGCFLHFGAGPHPPQKQRGPTLRSDPSRT